MKRLELRDALTNRLMKCDAVLAMWESGSHAFDRVDEFSDLDIGLLTRKDGIEDAWKAVEDALEDVGGFCIRWENPVHLFSGMTQRVYRPTRGGRWLDLDIGIFQQPCDDLYLQPQRHGRATILFDRSEGQLTAGGSFDAAAHSQRMRQSLHQEIMRWNLFREFVAKELSRGRTIDAFAFYIAFVLRPVLTVLGMLHRPDRFDYGFRYVRQELPADAVKAIERLCYVESPGELLGRVDEANRLFAGALEELKRRGIEPLDPKGIDRLDA
jgi:hypothetical protein